MKSSQQRAPLFQKCCSFTTVQEIAQSIPVAPQSLDDVSVQAIDFFDIVKFLSCSPVLVTCLEHT